MLWCSAWHYMVPLLLAAPFCEPAGTGFLLMNIVHWLLCESLGMELNAQHMLDTSRGCCLQRHNWEGTRTGMLTTPPPPSSLPLSAEQILPG